MSYKERRLLLEQRMKSALIQAQEAERSGEVPVGAIVVYEDEIIAQAHNMTEKNNNALNHAEVIAIQKAMNIIGSKYLIGCELYVTLEPCTMCAGAIVLARLEKVIFGAYDSKAGACGSLLDIPQHPLLNHRPMVIGGILEKECSSLLQNFFHLKRHT